MNTINFNECQLCGDDQSPLQESHLVPKFVSDWIKETSKTGFIRAMDNPEERLQDGFKIPMLCTKCERKFSNWEGKFAEHIFKRIANYRKQTESFTISDDHILCLISIFWRLLKYNSLTQTDLWDCDKAAYEVLLAKFKDCILKGDCNVDIYYATVKRESDYWGLTDMESIMTLERAQGDGSAIFLDDPHRYYSVLRLPFFIFYIFSDNWEKQEITPAQLFTKGETNPLLANQLPMVILDHIKWSINNLKQKQKKLSNKSKQSIISSAIKNSYITGTDKSLKSVK